MKYHRLPLRPMQESGAFLLRAMQNEDMPRLDLLVRESVQNALDAALDRQPGGEVRISFHLRMHTTETIASLLDEGVERKVLLENHPKGGQLLEIRDSLTEGLTGPLGFDEIGPDGVHGNLLKLVYEIGRTRSDAEAGGSWGLGKTCYFQMGVGLVFYYSRIKLGDSYQERLVASLVEDETKPGRMQSGTQTGIGWWGADEGLKPVTKPTEILQTLELLRVQRFTGTETGTSIIIPFLRENLIEARDPDSNGIIENRPWWYNSYEDYIRIALERWFCARLDNPYFATGPRLTAAVNNKVITSSAMLPIFQTAQALYNRANGMCSHEADYLTRLNVPADMIIKQPVVPRSLFSPPGAAGNVAAALLTPEQLGMAAPLNNYDPGLCVFGRSAATPPYRPLVTFMRRPGMCVSWDDSTESRGWAGGLPGLADGRYLVAVFVPLQERVLANAGRRSQEEVPVTLESYLRSCERADHTNWHDTIGMRVVEKIRMNCGRILRDFGTRAPPIAAVAHSIRMARNLANLVLPARGMGTDGRFGRSPPQRGAAGGEKGSKGGGGRRRSMQSTPFLEVLDIAYTSQGMQVHWLLEWGNADHNIPRHIFLKVDSEAGPISVQQWRSEGLGMFPFGIFDAQIYFDSENSTGITIEIGRGDDEGILLRTSSSNRIDELKGVLTIRLLSDDAGTLRPAIAAGLTESNSENA